MFNTKEMKNNLKSIKKKLEKKILPQLHNTNKKKPTANIFLVSFF